MTDARLGPFSDGSTNPGNNLHVSGLSSRVDNRALEDLFAKYGRVSFDIHLIMTLADFVTGSEGCGHVRPAHSRVARFWFRHDGDR